MKTSHSKSKKKPIPNGIRERCMKTFQQLRRLEEANDEGYVTCISCGRRLLWSEAQGGHYVSRSCRATEIEKDNIWPQCPKCNGLLNGNVVMYRMHLVRRIGEDRVRRIENMAAAYNGDEDAMESLSDRDKIEVVRKKSKQYYFDRNKEYMDECRRIRKEKNF